MRSNLNLAEAQWRKSSHSSDTGGECIEIATRPHTIAIRDSKNPQGPAITIAPTTFQAFVTAAANGHW